MERQLGPQVVCDSASAQLCMAVLYKAVFRAAADRPPSPHEP